MLHGRTVAYSMMVKKALDAAEILAGEGIEAEVVDPRTLVPLDVDTVVDSVKKTNRLIIASEECGRAGVNGEIAFRVIEEAFDYLDAPIARVTAANVPVPFSPPLEEFIMPKVGDIVQMAHRILGR
jgi:pyruvate/2-oxoglutarate/acetoin dehydrogenase E1 component